MVELLPLFVHIINSRQPKSDHDNKRPLPCCTSEETTRLPGNGVSDFGQAGIPCRALSLFHSANHPLSSLNMRPGFGATRYGKLSGP